MHCCIPTATTDNNTSTGMIWVTLNMGRSAGKCQWISRCLESGCPETFDVSIRLLLSLTWWWRQELPTYSVLLFQVVKVRWMSWRWHCVWHLHLKIVVPTVYFAYNEYSMNLLLAVFTIYVQRLGLAHVCPGYCCYRIGPIRFLAGWRKTHSWIRVSLVSLGLVVYVFCVVYYFC